MSELPVYDGDFVGPHQFLSRTPDLDIRVASLGGQSITADRLPFLTLAAVESSDVLLVPAGGCLAEVPSMRDGWVFLTLIRTQVAARSIGAPAMPSVPGNRTNHTCLSHPWSEM
jgi:hypothetical protein